MYEVSNTSLSYTINLPFEYLIIITYVFHFIIKIPRENLCEIENLYFSKYEKHQETRMPTYDKPC